MQDNIVELTEEMLNIAYDIAQEIEGVDMDHIDRVSQKMKSPAGVMVAYLHEALPSKTPEDLIERGIPLFIVEQVQALMKHDDETFKDYVMRLHFSKFTLARLVAIFDIRDKMANLSEGDTKDMYRLAEWVLSHEKVTNKRDHR